MQSSAWRKTVISALAVITLFGGAASAFADGKGKGPDKGAKGNNYRYDERKPSDRKSSNEIVIRLQFKDENELKWALVPIMRLASKGVFTGYEDGTFKPNRPVTRAELAALLDRTDSQLPGAKDERTVTGVVKASTTGAIVVTRSDNTDVVLPIAMNAFIFRAGAKVDASALRAGDKVFVLTHNGEAVFIEVTQAASPSNTFTDAGILNSVTLNAEGRLATISLMKATDGGTLAVIYNVSHNVRIFGDASLLVAGSSVEVSGTNSTVTKIVIKS